MTVKFLGQGYEASSENAVGNYLAKFFADKQFHSFYGITAFTGLAGIKILESYLASATHLKSISMITGVDQKGTSQEALQALLELRVNAFVFFVPPPSPIFHPKLYLFEGKERSELIVGSSNLTGRGLFANIEASVLMSADNSVAADRKTISELKEYFSGLFTYNDPNLQPLTRELIDNLVKAKIIPTEAERKALHDKGETSDRTGTEEIFSKLFPRRAAAKVPYPPTSNNKPKAEPAKVPGGLPSSTNPVKYGTLKAIPAVEPPVLLWESGPLTERDLNIPSGLNTAPTGSMFFKKGQTENIDQKHYFRDQVFSSLEWVFNTRKNATHLEKANALFRLIVLGKDHGTFTLKLTHDPRTDTISYEQNNSMTSVSWGKAKSIIARQELIGKNAKLYRSQDNNEEYILVID